MSAATRFKICCIASIEEAQLAIRYGASAVGLVSAMPSGPGVIPESTIAEIAARIPPGVSSFLLTSLASAEAIAEQHRRCGTDTVQICDRLAAGAHRRLRRALPGIRLVQVVHVQDESSVDEALTIAEDVDALLLDSGDLRSPTKELGGTGRTHDWSLSRRIVAGSPRPVWLAGGLRPENVAEAVQAVRPFAVDVCSGLRAQGGLEETRLRDFVAALRRA